MKHAIKRLSVFKWLGILCAAILLSLAAGAAISAVAGLDAESGARNLPAALDRIFASWRGSKPMIALAVLCVVLVIAGKGIERR